MSPFPFFSAAPFLGSTFSSSAGSFSSSAGSFSSSAVALRAHIRAPRSAAPRARNSQWFSWHADRGPLNWAAQMAMVQFTLIEEGALSTGSSESASSSTGCGSPAQTSPFNLNEMD